MGRRLTAVSLFSGCGGFDWGAHQAGVDILWANDIDPHAAAAYKAVFNNTEFIQRDIEEVKRFPQADILIGCYPCTGFSLGSRRRWRDADMRDLHAKKDNFLYQQFMRALLFVRPKYLFVENVQGMNSAGDGWFFRQQWLGFREYGYKISYKVLMAHDFGVPQTRKRMFLVGVRDDISFYFSYAFPQPTHGPTTDTSYVNLHTALQGMESWPKGEYFDYPFHGHYLTRNRKRPWTKPSYTIVADKHHVPLHPMGEPMVFVAKDHWALQGDENRRLSWRECAAIQGLPAKAEPSGTLENKYRVVGNSVPPTFGKKLLEPIVRFEAMC